MQASVTGIHGICMTVRSAQPVSLLISNYRISSVSRRVYQEY